MLTYHDSFNLALAFFVPPAFTNIQWKTYMIFGTFCAVMTAHIFFTYPETSGKTLEEVDELFASNVPAWRSKNATRNFEDRVAAAEKSADIVHQENRETASA